MSTLQYRYCPQCAQPLAQRDHGGAQRMVCTAEPCGFVQWGNPVPVVAALVEYQGKILLARNAAWPAEFYALITGFLERNESPEEGVARELKEETNLDAVETSLIGVYPFQRKNEVIMAYHVKAEGEVSLSEELVAYKLIEPAKLRPWRMGTGLAMAHWMQARGLDVQWLEF
ncbi:MAG TPA: NUDIX domain-containing protein [Limnobacter sp.]|uniref:NUDIX domain-containing protein n=1 Tax=Limnobacter sp. TaxID=2003368 RepID=UPI002EDA3DD7